MATEGNSEGGWPGGWLAAVVAGVVGAVLARWLGDVGMAAAVLVGIFVFLVFGILLGMFWAAPASGDHGGHDHGHGDTAHGGHEHADHAPEAAAAPTPIVARLRHLLPRSCTGGTGHGAAPVMAAAGEVRPAGLSGPRGGVADKLQTVEGIGPALEKLCHELGIYHFDQIAAWGEAEIAWMDSNLKGFKGRVTRDKWVRQARLIGEIGIPAFLIRAKTNDY